MVKMFWCKNLRLGGTIYCKISLVASQYLVILIEDTKYALEQDFIFLYKQKTQHYNVSQKLFLKNFTAEIDVKFWKEYFNYFSKIFHILKKNLTDLHQIKSKLGFYTFLSSKIDRPGSNCNLKRIVELIFKKISYLTNTLN